jgi:hypothetical protein
MFCLAKFYILSTMHHVMILGKWPTWRTILFCVFISIYNSLHVSSTSCSSSGETNCVNTNFGRWAEHVARMGEWRGAYRVLVVRPERTTPLEIYRHRWEDNTKKDLQEISGSWTVQVSCAGRKWTFDLHTKRPPTATRGCIDTICLSWWWARCARNM